MKRPNEQGSHVKVDNPKAKYKTEHDLPDCEILVNKVIAVTMTI